MGSAWAAILTVFLRIEDTFKFRGNGIAAKIWADRSSARCLPDDCRGWGQYRGQTEQTYPAPFVRGPKTVKLQLDGKMDRFWLRLDNKGVIFLMTTESAQEADELRQRSAGTSRGPVRKRIIKHAKADLESEAI